MSTTEPKGKTFDARIGDHFRQLKGWKTEIVRGKHNETENLIGVRATKGSTTFELTFAYTKDHELKASEFAIEHAVASFVSQRMGRG